MAIQPLVLNALQRTIRTPLLGSVSYVTLKLATRLEPLMEQDHAAFAPTSSLPAPSAEQTEPVTAALSVLVVSIYSPALLMVSMISVWPAQPPTNTRATHLTPVAQNLVIFAPAPFPTVLHALQEPLAVLVLLLTSD